jgi:hypothetical protein
MRTDDIVFASTLSLHKYPLIGLERCSKSKAYFLFADEEGLGEFEAAFYNGEIFVEPREFNNKVRELKTRVNNLLREL